MQTKPKPQNIVIGGKKSILPERAEWQAYLWRRNFFNFCKNIKYFLSV
tara:strand:+ start:93 stop:236 length:144 start_codon:yes stop_codon:yes gene_type:complete